MDGKVEVSVDADGNVLKCAKGAAAGECGYVPGAKICGKCGALPVEMKMVRVDGYGEKNMMPWESEDDEEMAPKMKKRKAMGMGEDDMEDEDMEDDEESYGMTPAKKGMGKIKPAPIVLGQDEQQEDVPDDEAAEAAMAAKKSKKGMGMEMPMEEEDDEEGDEEDGMPMGMGADLETARKKRLAALGHKSAEFGRNAYMCAIERKVYPGGAGVCDDCPGGCVAERGMPGLLSVEGIAEDMFQGKVLDSGYSSDADMFVVDVQAKDGRAVEVFIDGTTAEVLGFHKLDDSAFEQKSALDQIMVIDFKEAADIAVKSIQGNVVAVEPDVFEGFDSYAVEIEGIDGKSYDVFVALDGEVLGYDKYEPEEAEAIEAEAAEIALKRAFSEDVRNQMAKEGTALPDGSFPISNVSDLKNAISAYGRAKDKEAAKKHIMKRAKALNQDKLIPENWVTGGAKVVEEKSGEDSSIVSSLIEFELLEAELNNTDNQI